LLETVLDEPLAPLGYDERLQAVLRRGVGLWDTVASAEREGSLDAAMRSISANPLTELVGKLPALRAVAFNGGTSARIGRREVSRTTLALIDLPSSSPAHTMAFSEKVERWAALRPFVIDRA
jgi:hypoxanthine-DNA glycosylase